MPYKHNKNCTSCARIKLEVGKSHKGRVVSRLFKLFDDYLMQKTTLVAIAEEYKGLVPLASISRHSQKHQTFGSEDIAVSKVKELQKKSSDEKIKLILKSAIKADDMRGMMKQMFEEIMEDEGKRAEFMRKFKPSDAIKMMNDEETLELKKVDTAHEIVKTMNAFASGGTIIQLPEEQD